MLRVYVHIRNFIYNQKLRVNTLMKQHLFKIGA